jgi:uncharacterized Zn finger protein
MLFAVSNAVKKRLCQVFQEIVSTHPIFEKTKVYTKFPQEERPKTALIIRSVSGGSQKLGLDNFITTQVGFSTLANLKGISGDSLEWVRDDQENLDKISPPGFYIVKITAHDPETNNFTFVVDPYLIVDDEQTTIKFIKGKEGIQLKNKPVNPNSETVYSQSHKFEFKRDIEYTIDYQTGEILFSETVDKKYTPITVDYQVLSTQKGPFTTEYYMLDNIAIPGVILAFGDRLKVGDEQVIVVENRQREVAKVYGGRWQLNVDIICIAQDPDQQERLLDFVITSFWARYQDILANEGMSVIDFSLSGEAEDLETDLPEEYSFTAGISFSMETDWELHVPMISTLRRTVTDYGEGSFKDNIDYLTEEKYITNQYDERMINSNHQKGLQISPSLDKFQVFPSPFPRVVPRKYE